MKQKWLAHMLIIRAASLPQEAYGLYLICRFSIGIGIAFQAAPQGEGDAY